MGMPSIFPLLLSVQHILMFHLTFHILKALTYIKLPENVNLFCHFLTIPSDTAHNEYRKLLLLHNHDDIEGMLSLLPLVSYYAIIMNSYTVDNAVIDKDTDSDGNVSLRLIAECSLPVGVPVDRHICIDNIHIRYFEIFF